MKKIGILLLTVFLLFGFSLAAAAASDGDIDRYAEEYGAGKLTEALPDGTAELLEALGIDSVSFEKLRSVTPGKVFDVLIDVLTGSLKKPFSALTVAVGLMALTFFFENTAKKNEYIGVIGSCCIALTLTVPLAGLVTDTFSVISSLSSFTVVFSGVFCGVISAAGGTVLAASFGTATVAFGTILSKLCEGFSRPAVNAMCTLAFLSGLDLYSVSARFSKLIKQCYFFFLGILSIIFTGLVSVRSTLAADADTIAAKSIRFAVGKSLPVVGGAVSESYSAILASFGLIKSTVGVFGIVTVALTVLPTVFSLAAWLLALSIALAFAESFGSNRAADFIGALRDVVTLLLATVAFTGLIMIIVIGVVIKTRTVLM